MTNYSQIIEKYLQPDDNVREIIIFSGNNKILFSSGNWEIDQDVISYLNSIWNEKSKKSLILAGKKYNLIQNSPNRIVGVSIEKDLHNISKKEGILGLKTDNIGILCQLSYKGDMYSPLGTIGKILSEIEPKSIISKKKKDETKEINKSEFPDLNPKVLSETTKLLEKMGLESIGLSEDDANVYLTLLRLGEEGEKVGKLNKLINLKRTHIYRIIDRLIQKNWVEKINKPSISVQYFVARPFTELLETFIKEKEEELKVLKGLKLLMTRDTGTGWNLISEERAELKKEFDINIQEIMGIEKDWGIVVFEYDRIIKGEEKLDKVKLRIYARKLERSIWERKEIGKLDDLKDVKVEEKMIKNYEGAELMIRFEENSKSANNLGEKWLLVARLISIPIDNKIYVIWGTESKFDLLTNLIQKIG